jgi:glycosyltransferase involved in cell wall biosynthesis
LVGKALQVKLQEADVFVMPYDIRQPPVSAITAPNKLFQYLACGRPVVCSNLPSLIELPEKFIYRAADAKQFVAAVERAFAEDDSAAALDRLEYASRNTWALRGEALRDLLAPAVAI